LGASHVLHLPEDGLMLRVIIPLKDEGMWVAVGCVRYCDHLVQIGWQTCELGQIRLCHGARGLAMMQIGAAWIIVQRCPSTTDGPYVAC
jgi:hypothetical protein